MITKENYDKNHILLLQEKSKRDPQLLERTLHAFGLLEALCKVNMPFIFKGGTCLMLLLEHPGRLSTDIDIIVKPGLLLNGTSTQREKFFHSINKRSR